MTREPVTTTCSTVCATAAEQQIAESAAPHAKKFLILTGYPSLRCSFVVKFVARALTSRR